MIQIVYKKILILYLFIYFKQYPFSILTELFFVGKKGAAFL